MDRRFVVLCVVLLVLEAGALIAFGNRDFRGDEHEYVAYARHLIDDGVFSRGEGPSLYRTPGYPAFLAGLRVVSASLVLVTIVQVFLLGVTAALLYLAAHRVAGVRAAEIAAVATITYLPFVWLTNIELTETLATALTTAAVVALLYAPQPSYYAAAGVLMGAAGLVRPIFVAAAIPATLGGLIWPRHTLLAVLLIPMCAGLVVTPWLARNYELTDGQLRLAGGNSVSVYASAMQYQGRVGYAFDGAELKRLYDAVGPTIRRARRQAREERSDIPLSVRKELAVEDELGPVASEQLRSIGPIDALREVPRRVAYLWAVGDYPQFGGYTVWHLLARAQHLLLLIFAFGGVWMIRKRLSEVWPLFLFPVFLTGCHLVLHSESRYSIPGRPALIVLASVALAGVMARMQAAAKAEKVTVPG